MMPMKKKGSFFIFILIIPAFLYNGCRKDEKTSLPLADIEGNTYKTKKIGSQLWMTENLRSTKLNDGTEIPLTQDPVQWSNLTAPGFCWYNNDPETYRDSYGALYNGFTVSTGKLCPDGWHIPEKREWVELRDFLADSLQAGGKLKETGTTHWLPPNKGADNSSGFTALGAGFRYFEGSFSSILAFSSIWSATEAFGNNQWYIGLYYGDSSFSIDHRNPKHGFSVRCVQD
jgi:uncharacterized protein (TIGR02145 family)